MKYIRVAWRHQHAEQPIILYHELNAQRWETRKIEVFRNGHIGYASAESESGGTGLSTEPLPELSEIAKDSQFEPAEITPEEFESIWSQRKH